MPSKKTKHKTSRHSSHAIPYVPLDILPIIFFQSSQPLSFDSLFLTFFSSMPSISRRETSLASPSSTPNNTYHNLPPASHALTPQVLHEHEHSQLALQQDPNYLRTAYNQHTTQLHASFDSLGVDLPDSVYSRAVQEPVGMTPPERFEFDSTYPHQPVLPQQHTSYHNSQYSHIALQSEPQQHQHAPPPDSSLQGQNVVYYAPQQEYYYIPATTYGEATGPGNDLAAVGTQFGGYVPQGYAQTF
ncbi:hypothetical protein N431DRAFT_487362 [Stipitochalara longipes BDJ]|nr:hypothetical protein N431DRAFT_487362 [Stipitochalara longipes BDJ]